MIVTSKISSAMGSLPAEEFWILNPSITRPARRIPVVNGILYDLGHRRRRTKDAGKKTLKKIKRT
jgi:hypothetical protein